MYMKHNEYGDCFTRQEIRRRSMKQSPLSSFAESSIAVKKFI